MFERLIKIGLIAVSVATSSLVSGCMNTPEKAIHSQEIVNFSLKLNDLIGEKSNNELETEQKELSSLTQLIQLPELNALIQAALKESPDLKQSMLALKIIETQSTIINAQRQPTANANFTSSKSKAASNNIYSTELTTSWELDFFGKLANQGEAARLDILAQSQNLAQIRNILISNIMKSWLNITLQKLLIDLENERLDTQKKILDLIKSRYRSGLDPLGALDNARSRYFTTLANIESLSQSKYEAEQSLASFVGIFEQELNINELDLKFPKVLKPTSSISIQHVYDRPDVKLGLLSIKAEELRTDAAYKALLPSFSITIAVNDSSHSPVAALLTDPIWNFLGQLSAPIFQGGRLQAQAESAELKFAQQVWKYQNTLLTAVREIETSITAEQIFTRRAAHLSNAVKNANSSYRSFLEKYQQGLVDIFDLLNTQEQTFDLQAKLLQTTHQHLTNRINLGLALGLGAKNEI